MGNAREILHSLEGETGVSARVAVTWLLLLVSTSALLLGGVGSAQAASTAALAPGVHVDPSSPAGKEYAIPLGQARGDGGSTSAGGRLFGSGIVGSVRSNGSGSGRAGGSNPGSARGGSRRTHAAAKRRSGASGARSGQSGAASSRQASSQDEVLGSGQGSGAGVAWMIGTAILVLALGGGGGAMLARRTRGTSVPLA